MHWEMKLFDPFFFLSLFSIVFFFFFNDTATTEIYTLSLHDALRDLALLSPRGRRRHAPPRVPPDRGDCRRARGVARDAQGHAHRILPKARLPEGAPQPVVLPLHRALDGGASVAQRPVAGAWGLGGVPPR